MREVPALVEAHADNRIARLDKRHVRSKVGVSTRVRLHVGKTAAEQLASAFAGKVLDNIDLFTAAVIALTRIALGILVGEHATHGLHDSGRDDVLGCDELDGAPLTAKLLRKGREHLGVGLDDVVIGHGRAPLG